ncbi:hypothetical protein QE152_g12668 [Popillia japonica]|uniref:Uncharacterized protein n=1 Tax=Popillia japonica TaxID=7064 RepID=A0AAW1LIR3_POPJA
MTLSQVTAGVLSLVITFRGVVFALNYVNTVCAKDDTSPTELYNTTDSEDTSDSPKLTPANFLNHGQNNVTSINSSILQIVQS